MNTANPAFLKLAIVGIMACGAIVMPLAASAQATANDGVNNCRGLLISWFTTREGGIGRSSREAGQSVREGQQIVGLFCDAVTGQE